MSWAKPLRLMVFQPAVSRLKGSGVELALQYVDIQSLYTYVQGKMERRGTATPAVSNDVMTVQDVASYLRVTSKTVYSLIKNGSLASFRVGRAVRCRLASVEAFILRCSHPVSEVLQSQRHANEGGEG